MKQYAEQPPTGSDRKTANRTPVFKSEISNQKSEIHRHAGTAVSEMVLVLPLLLLILALLVFFGKAVVRLQHAQVMDRYEAWRQVARGPGAHVDPQRGNPLMNQGFYNNHATHIEYTGYGGFPNDAESRLLGGLTGRALEAGDYAQRLFEMFPDGLTVEFRTAHRNGVPALRRFQSKIHHGHTRIEHDWAFVNGFPGDSPTGPGASNLPALRDVFYPDFDRNMSGIADDENPMAAMIRSLYLNEPGYAGPTINVQ